MTKSYDKCELQQFLLMKMMKSQIYILAATVLFFVGSDGSISFPNATAPCILVDLTGNLTIVTKPTDGSQGLKTATSLDGATAAPTSQCAGSSSSAELDLMLNGLSGTLALLFTKGADSKVHMDVKFTFIPNAVFKNNDMTPVTMEDVGDSVLSKDTASYTCSETKDIPFQQKGMYELKLSIGRVQIQAFNVNQKYSEAEDCSTLDVVSTEGPTTAPPPPSTQPPAPTTQPPAQTTESQTNGTSEAPKAPTTEPPSNKSTSEAPKTSMAPSNISTVAPVTSEAPTSMVPTTTEPPTPAPGSPEVHTYFAKNSTGSACIMMKAGIEFKIPYNNTKKEATSKVIGIPENITSVSGECNGLNGTQSLQITFYNDWTVTMTFSQDGTSSYLSEVELFVNVNKELIPDCEPFSKTITQTFQSGQFSASKSGSYKCNEDSKVTLNNGGFEMDTYNLQYAAFQNNITAFKDSDITECSADSSTNSVVPIAVGAALAGLVVIVLIAYLIGRKRSRQSGYEQV